MIFDFAYPTSTELRLSAEGVLSKGRWWGCPTVTSEEAFEYVLTKMMRANDDPELKDGEEACFLLLLAAESMGDL